MARFDFIATYLMANRKNGAIYTGCTSDLPARVYQHKRGVGSRFTAQYKCYKLVWFERFEEMAFAVQREKQIKRWPRQWKINLIEQANPVWLDLSKELL